MATRIREKAKARLEQKDARPRAVAKMVRMSPYKVRSVLDVVRGKSYNDAVAILSQMNKAASEPILKVVNSAAANAENNLGKKHAAGCDGYYRDKIELAEAALRALYAYKEE